MENACCQFLIWPRDLAIFSLLKVVMQIIRELSQKLDWSHAILVLFLTWTDLVLEFWQMYFGLAASWIWSPCIWPFGSFRKPEPWEIGQLVAWQQKCFKGSFPFEGGDCRNYVTNNIILLLYTTWLLLREKEWSCCTTSWEPLKQQYKWEPKMGC